MEQQSSHLHRPTVDYHSVPESGGRLLHSDPGAHSAARHKYPQSVAPRHPSIPPPSLSSSRCLFTFTQQKPRGWRPKSSPTWVFGGFSLHPSILPLSSPSSSSCSPSQRPPLPHVPSSISLNFQLDVSEMLINSSRGGDDIADKRRLFRRWNSQKAVPLAPVLLPSSDCSHVTVSR